MSVEGVDSAGNSGAERVAEARRAEATRDRGVGKEDKDLISAAARAADPQMGVQRVTGTTAPSDGVEKVDGARTTTGLSSELRAKADELKGRFARADQAERDPKVLNFREPNDERRGALNDAVKTAKGIQDPTQRDAFIKEIAPEAGRAAGKVSLRDKGVISTAETLANMGSKDTARTLAQNAIQTGGAYEWSAMAQRGGTTSEVANEQREKNNADLGAKLKEGARHVVPYLDAGLKLKEGDTAGAAKSAAIDTAAMAGGYAAGKLIAKGVQAVRGLWKGAGAATEAAGQTAGKTGATAGEEVAAKKAADEAAAARTAAEAARKERLAQFTDPKERAIAEHLEGLGEKVTKNPLEGVAGAGRQGDAFVNGVKTEFKTLEPGASSSTIRNVVNNSIRRGGQARELVIDARGSGLDAEAAKAGIERAMGISRGKIDRIRIIGDNYML